MNDDGSQSRVTVTHAYFLLSGDPSIWDKGSDESQLLVERCRQPHSFHQNQNQRPQWGPVHHPPCRGGSHIRCASKPLWIFIMYHTYIVILSVILSVQVSIFLFCAHFLQPLVYTPPQRCLTLVRCGHKVWSATEEVTSCSFSPAVFLTGLLFSLSLRCLFQLVILQIVQNCWICTF